MRRPDRWSLFTIALVLIGLSAVLYFVTIAPPAPVRYLPKASGILYIDLKPLRAAGFFERNRVTPEEDYQQFINATGIDFERDIDEAAFAMNEIPVEGASAWLDRRISYSEVFVGRFDAVRLGAYLTGIAAEKEHYKGREIYNLQLPGRTDRVSILGRDTVAVSNALGADEMRAMIDRYSLSLIAGLPFEEGSGLRRYYRHVPLGSVVWAILRLKSTPADDGLDLRHLFTGYGFLFPPGTTVVASSRYVGAVQVRAEAFTESPAGAQKIVSSFDTLLHMFKSAGPGKGSNGETPDLAAVLDGIKIEQKDNRAIFTASLPEKLLQNLFEPSTH